MQADNYYLFCREEALCKEVRKHEHRQHVVHLFQKKKKVNVGVL